jgi:class 3 adenylate cyclase
VALAAGQLIAIETFTTVVPYPIVMMSILVTGIVGVLAVMVIDAWRGNPEARTLVVGAGIVIACFAGETLAYTLKLPRRGIAQVLYSGTEVGHILFSFSMALALANRFSRSLEALDATHQQLKLTYEAAARFVPTDLLRILGHRTIRDIRLGDQIAMPMSTLFCDIRGFSALAERIGPAKAFELINAYLRVMEPEIHGHHGLILQYFGDGIMVLFPGPADDAIRAGIAMHAALDRFNEKQRATGEPPIAVGIGVNTGQVMVGTIGGTERLDSGVVGDAVNLASRIEGMTRMYGSALLLGETTVAELADQARYSFREVDRVVAKGTTSALSIFEVLDVLPPAQREPRTRSLVAYAAALTSLKRGAFAEASQAFAAIATADPQDRAAAVMSQRAAELAAQPPASWLGASLLATK